MQPLQPVPPQGPKLKKARPTPFAVKKSLNLGQFPESQEWLFTRFDKLTPEEISDKCLVMYTARGLTAPPGFHKIWHPICEHHRAVGETPVEEAAWLSTAQVVLVFADINDRKQVEDIKHLARFLIQFYTSPTTRPSVIFVQHSVKPSLRPVVSKDLQFDSLTDISRHGVCDWIMDERASFRLSWDVQNKLRQREATQQQWRDFVIENRELIEVGQEMDWNIDGFYWDYLRVRLNTHLPAVDVDIPGMPLEIDGVQIGPFVGAGLRGEVYGLTTASGEAIGHVLKRIPKLPITTTPEIERLRQEIDVMELISSEGYSHPNVAKLHNVYHSDTHIFFRMDDGGTRDLLKRLRHRENKHSLANAINPDKAKAICQQMLSAISFLHTGPKVVHCDIKPENIIVSETAGTIDITIVDFDTAKVQPSNPSYGVVGTYPRMAPEILLHEQYNPYAADVWSMALVILDVACNGGFFDRAVGIHRLTAQVPRRILKAHQRKMTVIMHKFFSEQDSSSRLLEEHLRPELQELMPLLVQILPGMLAVRIYNRSKSSDVLSAFDRLAIETDVAR